MREKFRYVGTNLLLNVDNSPLTMKEITSALKNSDIILSVNIQDLSGFYVDEEKVDKRKLTSEELSDFADEITSSIYHSTLAKANIKMVIYIKIKKLIYIGIIGKQIFKKYHYSVIQDNNKVTKIQEAFFNSTKDKEVEHFIEDVGQFKFNSCLWSLFYTYGCYKVGITFCESKCIPITYSIIDDTDPNSFYSIINDVTFETLLLQTQLNDERNYTLKTALSDINKKDGLISFLYNHFPPESLESKIKIIETLKELDIEIDKEI